MNFQSKGKLHSLTRLERQSNKGLGRLQDRAIGHITAYKVLYCPYSSNCYCGADCSCPLLGHRPCQGLYYDDKTQMLFTIEDLCVTVTRHCTDSWH